MLDIQDRFVLFLMTNFYDSLKDQLKDYGLSLTKALEEDRTKDVDLYIQWIKETREMLDDLSDENMSPRDFMGLILGKYTELITDEV